MIQCNTKKGSIYCFNCEVTGKVVDSDLKNRSVLEMNIYVGNVKYEMTEGQLTEMFSVYGEVTSARIISDKETGRSKGFGFVEMPNDEEAKAAIEATNEKEIGGRTLKVNEARPREERPRRAPRY
jgi:RNA recognition motif-containing protein